MGHQFRRSSGRLFFFVFFGFFVFFVFVFLVSLVFFVFMVFVLWASARVVQFLYLLTVIGVSGSA